MKKSAIKNSNMKHFNRREFLRSSAGGLASVSALNAFAQRAMAQETNFKRMIIWYVPEGAAQQAFWPSQTGNIVINDNASINGRTPLSRPTSIRSYVDPAQATYCIQPLKKHMGDFAMYSGFVNAGGGGTGAHARTVNNALTGGLVNEGSIDQIVAEKVKGSSVLSSIYLPVYGHHILDRGASDSFMSPLRRVGGGTFGSSNWNPMDVYKQVFPSGVPAPMGGGGSAELPYGENNIRVETLLSIEKRLQAIQCLGGDEARTKMEVLLSSYQKLEKDTQAIINAELSVAGGSTDLRFTIPNGWDNNAGTRNDTTKYWNQSDNFEKLADIAIDTTVAALALDRTRVSVMQFSASGNAKGPAKGNHYTTVGIQGIEGGVADHHLGHESDPVRRRDQARVFRWYYSKLSELVDKLKAIPDGDGTLFDSTLIVTASEFGSYDHRSNDVPYIVMGGNKFNFKKGQYMDVHNGTEHRSHADFLYGVTRQMDVNLDHFGTSRTVYNL